MAAPPSVSIGDLEHAFYLAAVPAADNNLAVTMGQGIKSSPPQMANKYASVIQAHSTGFAPAAGTVIATVTAPNTGYYKVQFSVGYGGVAETTTLDNYVLTNNAVTVTSIPAVFIANSMGPVFEVYLNVTAGQAIAVAVGGTNSSANTTCKAYVSITQVA